MANNTEQLRLKERLKELQRQYADSLSDVYLTDAQVNALSEDLAPSIEAEATRARIDELEKWLPIADTWAKQEGIYGPQIQFKRRIAELSATQVKEEE